MNTPLNTIVEALQKIAVSKGGDYLFTCNIARKALEAAIGDKIAPSTLTDKRAKMGAIVLERIAENELSTPQSAAKEVLRDMGIKPQSPAPVTRPTLSNDELCEMLGDIMENIKLVRGELRRKGYPQETLNHLAIAHSWVETAQNDMTGDEGTEILLG